MKTTHKDELLRYIENLDDYQIRIVLGFIRKLFRLDD